MLACIGAQRRQDLINSFSSPPPSLSAPLGCCAAARLAAPCWGLGCVCARVCARVCAVVFRWRWRSRPKRSRPPRLPPTPVPKRPRGPSPPPRPSSATPRSRPQPPRKPRAVLCVGAAAAGRAAGGVRATRWSRRRRPSPPSEGRAAAEAAAGRWRRQGAGRWGSGQPSSWTRRRARVGTRPSA